MPDRHHWAVKKAASDRRCQVFLCPWQAGFLGIYVFQHEGEAQATRRTKALCHRHAQSWAAQHGVEWPDGEPDASPPPLPAGHQPFIRPDYSLWCAAHEESAFQVQPAVTTRVRRWFPWDI